MDQTEQITVRLKVEDEASLYSRFSPEDEFSASVKGYLRSKIANKDDHQAINLTVMSRDPINEERFRSASSNWIRDEKNDFRKREKDMYRRLIIHLILGSLLLLLNKMIEVDAPEVQYSLLPIMASLALGSGAGILVKELPEIHKLKWLIRETKETSVITFEYGDGQTAQRCNPTVPTGGAE